MSVSSVDIAPSFSLIWLERLVLVLLQVARVFSHSASTSDFLSVNSVFNVVRVSMMPWEWYLYVGSRGSTEAAWRRKAATSCRRLAAERSRASARARLLSTELFSAMSAAGLASSRACMALVRPRMALARSASVASYSAWSLAHCSLVSCRFADSSSCVACLSRSSVALLSFSAVFCSMSAESVSMLSFPVVMLVDFVPVMSLQKQANWS
mmetsp:Transcript_76279/g.184533  ORF Transcript_76279/g.184533 Transcript_76279/m.184533 type:complete len:210 (+) Transcript_76279:1459-2088(+)